MVKSQAIHLTLRDQLKKKTVGFLEDILILNLNAGQVVRIKKSPIVDVIRGNSPIRQAEGLRLDEFMQFLETRRIRDVAIDRINCLKNAGFDRRRSAT